MDMHTSDDSVGRTADPQGRVTAAGPSVLRLLLGSRLRRLREDAGVTPERAGHVIRASPSKISRMELGRSAFKHRDVVDLLDLYGVAEDTAVETMLELVRQSNAPPWWQAYADVVPEGFGEFLDMEQAASLVRGYTSHHVPDLLQTPDYARALIDHAHPEATAQENRKRLELRIRRQDQLVQDGPRLWVIVDEAALLRRVGDSATMRRQLLYLKELAEARTHTLQIMPLSAGACPANGAPIVLLRFPEDDLRDVVYLEQLTGGSFLSKPAEFDRYWNALNSLAIDARPPAATADFIADVMRQT
jgi:transcriptional regulator with XRE-family HTH domain